MVRYPWRDLPDRVEPLQLLNLGFGKLPLLHLRSQLPVGLPEFARSGFHAALERFLATFATGDVQRDPVERNWRVVLEMGLPARRDPAFHAVRFSDHPVLDVVHAVAPWVGAPLDRGLDARKIIRMYAGPPQIVVDRRACRQPPHGPQGVVPLQLVGLRIPRVAAQFAELDGGLPPRLALPPFLLGPAAFSLLLNRFV